MTYPPLPPNTPAVGVSEEPKIIDALRSVFHMHTHTHTTSVVIVLISFVSYRHMKRPVCLKYVRNGITVSESYSAMVVRRRRAEWKEEVYCSVKPPTICSWTRSISQPTVETLSSPDLSPSPSAVGPAPAGNFAFADVHRIDSYSTWT